MSKAGAASQDLGVREDQAAGVPSELVAPVASFQSLMRLGLVRRQLASTGERVDTEGRMIEEGQRGRQEVRAGEQEPSLIDLEGQ
eukprot:763625-Hanusia_phi.AAC.2